VATAPGAGVIRHLLVPRQPSRAAGGMAKSRWRGDVRRRLVGRDLGGHETCPGSAGCLNSSPATPEVEHWSPCVLPGFSSLHRGEARGTSGTNRADRSGAGSPVGLVRSRLLERGGRTVQRSGKQSAESRTAFLAWQGQSRGLCKEGHGRIMRPHRARAGETWLAQLWGRHAAGSSHGPAGVAVVFSLLAASSPLPSSLFIGAIGANGAGGRGEGRP